MNISFKNNLNLNSKADKGFLQKIPEQKLAEWSKFQGEQRYKAFANGGIGFLSASVAAFIVSSIVKKSIKTSAGIALGAGITGYFVGDFGTQILQIKKGLDNHKEFIV